MSDIQNEIIFFDKEAEYLLNVSPQKLLLKKPKDHLAGSGIAFDYMMERIGNINGKTILDVGCGCGWLSVYLVQHGARFVHGFDVSPKMIEVAKRRSHVNNIANKVQFKQNMAEEIKFNDNFFDLIVGISVLHHIDLQIFSNIIANLLKPGGKAIFIEPLGENKLIEFVRNKINLNLLGKRTDNEEPLKLADIEKFSDFFRVNHREFQLFGSFAKYIGDSAVSFLGLNALDKLMLHVFPSLNKQCRLIVIELSSQ